LAVKELAGAAAVHLAQLTPAALVASWSNAWRAVSTRIEGVRSAIMPSIVRYSRAVQEREIGPASPVWRMLIFVVQ